MSNGIPQAAARGATKRVAFFDNVKGLLIILVVMGHFMHPVHNDNPTMSTLFDIIYLFHMPLFVFMSGLFAKSAYRDGHLKVDRIISFIVLAFAYQIAIMVINGASFTWLRLLRFSSAPWYLLSMAWWYLLTPLLAQTRASVAMEGAFIASCLWGFVDMSGGFLAISRTFAFLPWFVAGYYCSLDQVLRVRRAPETWIAVVAAVAIMAFRLVNEGAYTPFFYLVYGDNPYLFGAKELLDKIVLTVVALVCGLAVLKLVPERSTPVAALGKRTLAIYVLHRLMRAWLTFHTGFYDLPFILDPVAGTLVVLALSGVVTLVCALPLWSRALDTVMRVPWTSAPSILRHRGAGRENRM